MDDGNIVTDSTTLITSVSSKQKKAAQISLVLNQKRKRRTVLTRAGVLPFSPSIWLAATQEPEPRLFLKYSEPLS